MTIDEIIEKGILYCDFDKHNLRQKLNEDNRKLALIQIGNTKKMSFVDNKTMKAYKADGYKKTWIEIKKFKFIRWATLFDC